MRGFPTARYPWEWADAVSYTHLKAGAYAVQGEGASLVERVDGALDTVIGLPVGRLLDEFPDLFAAR